MAESWSDILGQPQAITILRRAMEQKRLPPALLFVGVGGVGRRTTARVLIKHLLGKLSHPDLLWVEPTYSDRGKLLTASEVEAVGLKKRAGPQIRIEQVREISEFVSRVPLWSDRSVVVIESAETMTEASANALLKTLEEPGHATLILIATAVNQLLPTIISRCQQVPFKTLSLEHMGLILARLGITDMPETLLLQAEGSVGKALRSWQILQTIPSELLPQFPSSPCHCFTLAKAIAGLELDSQLWLMDYWQRWLWQAQANTALIYILEQGKQYLQNFVQPRLVWEVTLLAIHDQSECSPLRR